MSNFPALVRKLKEIFQIDRPELDFGVYRILNARSAEITKYLDEDLKDKVKHLLAVQQAGNQQQQLNQLVNELREEFGKRAFDTSGNLTDQDAIDSPLGQRYLALKNTSSQADSNENQVFSHLLTFFSRYYDNGDFISQRRYKGDTYAIPYSGEEVVLHWANKDQYYTKSGENFANYRFKLSDGRSVFFKLVAADTARENRKDNDKDRRFKLIDIDFVQTLVDDEGESYEQALEPIVVVNDELVIHFEYAPVGKGTKQDDLNSQAVTAILANDKVKSAWSELAKLDPTEKNPSRTLVEKCLSRYTSSNTADYFIHKDLGKFLRGELDFYIKNEVLHLDDVQNAQTFANIEQNLRLIQCLRAVALELVDFLASLEDFQKQLWLKKKFVVAAHYCLTLDRVPRELYAEIAANDSQLNQWLELGCIESKQVVSVKKWLLGEAVEPAKGQQDLLTDDAPVVVSPFSFLMVDTALFGIDFKARLLQAVDNLDELVDGVLVHGDNFQGLSLLQERYKEQVKCIYIDPPYNTGDGDFIYKDSFIHSSWLSFIENRVVLSSDYQTKDGAFFCNLDDNEFSNFKRLLDLSFPDLKFVGNVVWKHTEQSKNDELNFSRQWNYLLCYGKPLIGNFRLPRTDEDNKSYSNPDNDPEGLWRSGDVRSPSYRKTLCYNVISPSGFVIKTPENGWRWSEKELLKKIDTGEIIFSKNEDRIIRKIYLKNQEGRTPENLWIGERFGTTRSATHDLKSLFLESPFDTPKPKELIQSLIQLLNKNQDVLTLDYFGGSGTTAHAVINLNRQDNGQRKYILMEQGEYFDTVLKPRIQKVVFSQDWKEGKAQANNTGNFNGISHAFKVLKIESYEDTLNNLQLTRSKGQADLLNQMQPQERSQYLMHYMLKLESKGSLLSVTDFLKPFGYQLNITTDSAGAYQTRTVDLVETFNYLLGLRVKQIDMQLDKGFVQVIGTLPNGESALIFWRDCDKINYEQLNKLLDKLHINPRDAEYDVIYVNGDHNIPTVFQSTIDEGGITRTQKIRQIEREFLDRMFAGA